MNRRDFLKGMIATSIVAPIFAKLKRDDDPKEWEFRTGSFRSDTKILVVTEDEIFIGGTFTTSLEANEPIIATFNGTAWHEVGV